MHASYAPTPGTTRPSAATAARRVGGDLDVGPDPLQRALRRAQIARPVVQDNDAISLSQVPLVDGTPVTRGSGSTACRNARATALYSASVMWCGSRP